MRNVIFLLCFALLAFLCAIQISAAIDSYIEGDENRRIEIPCDIQLKSDDNQIQVKWYLNGSEIEIDDKEFKVSGTTLIILNSSRVYQGRYRCEIPGYEKSSEISLIVHYAPELNELEHENLFVNFGDSIELRCSGDGFPSPIAKWKKPFELEFSTNGSSLIISSFEASNEGEYICKLDNNVEPSVERRIIIRGSATAKPNILKPNITALTVCEGDDITLNCQCESCQLVTELIWLHQNDQHVTIPNNDTKMVKNHEKRNHLNYSWTLKSVPTSRSGFYTCYLKNEFGFDEMSIKINVRKSVDVGKLENSDSHYKCIENFSFKATKFETENPNLEIASNTYSCSSSNEENMDVSVILLETHSNEKIQSIFIRVNISMDSIVDSKCLLTELPQPKSPQSASKGLLPFNNIFQCIFPSDSSMSNTNPLYVIHVTKSSLSENDAKIIEIVSNSSLESVLECSIASDSLELNEQPYICKSYNNFNVTTKSFHWLTDAIKLPRRKLIRSVTDSIEVTYKPYWSKWSAFGPCSTTCGKGVQKKYRTCHKAPHDTADCLGINVRSKQCFSKPCQGQWSEWTEWSKCSKTCGSGQMYRHRECDGDVCEGSNMEIVGCSLAPC